MKTNSCTKMQSSVTFCLENNWKRNRNDFLKRLENIFQIISNFGKPIKLAMLEELFEKLFEKLKTEKKNDKKSKNGYFEYFVNVILKNDAYKISGFSITSKATKNYYEKYVEKKENKSGEPKSELKDLISKYLGYKNYTDFENSNKEVETSLAKKATLSKENKPFEEKVTSKRLKRNLTNKKTVLGILSVFLLSFFIYKYNNKDLETCIVWTENHFENSSCDDKNSINNKIYKVAIDKFEKIQVTKETSFFKKGKPMIWYGKSFAGKIEFFTHRGIHPETLKELDPVTEFIINKYVFTSKEEKTIIN